MTGLRVGMVLPNLVLAGMENVAVALALALKERGHSVQFLLTQNGGDQAAAVEGMGMAVTVLPLLGKRAFVGSPRLQHWLERERLDILHTHSGDWIKVAPVAHRIRGLTTVHTQHGIANRDLVSRILRWRAARQTDFFVAVSDSVAQELRADARVPQDRIAVVPNGVDTDVYKPAPQFRAQARTTIGIPGDVALVVGTVARMDPLKNHAMLLRAFTHFHAAHPSSALVLVGDGPSYNAVRAQAESLIGTGAVIMLGARTDVTNLLPAFDIVALPSRTEGTSMTLLEAMASGIPCVATSVGGTPALFDYGICGVLVPDDDEAAMASELGRLAIQPDERRRLGSAAREHIVRNYSLDGLARTHEAIYHRAAGLPSSHPVAQFTT